MDGKYPIAETASLFADPARSAMLVALLDGRSLPASELALMAKVSAQAASMHLGKLLAGRLVTMTRSGRHRYYRLAGPDVATAIEAMGTLCNGLRPIQAPGDGSTAPIRIARTCYDHLAGKVAVEVCESLQERKLLAPVDDTFRLTTRGERWLQDLGIDLNSLRANRKRPLVRNCLDWTERKFHLAGTVGAALLDLFRRREWIKRENGSRVVTITENGQTALRTHFGIVVPDSYDSQ
ncbi:MAG TPA: winged helix-turn-helix domain-containing protein [Chthoniobacterales bacterium]|nr:winged helix-turn-helix domain-containing protein [Chthoniobacterales bacterium]